MQPRLRFLLGILVSTLISCDLRGEAPPTPVWLKEVTRVVVVYNQSP